MGFVFFPILLNHERYLIWQRMRMKLRKVFNLLRVIQLNMEMSQNIRTILVWE